MKVSTVTFSDIIKSYDNSPDSISLRLTRRDIYDGDMAGIMFDTYHDKRTGFSFIVSAAGVKADYVLSEDGNGDAGFEIYLQKR